MPNETRNLLITQNQLESEPEPQENLICEELISEQKKTNQLLIKLYAMLSRSHVPLEALVKDVRTEISLATGLSSTFLTQRVEAASTAMLLEVSFGHDLDQVTSAPANQSGYNVKFELLIQGSPYKTWGVVPPTRDFNKSSTFNDTWKIGEPLQPGSTVAIRVNNNSGSTANFWARMRLWTKQYKRDEISDYDKQFEHERWPGVSKEFVAETTDPQGEPIGVLGGGDPRDRQKRNKIDGW